MADDARGADPGGVVAGSTEPVAVVWCRQVDNEAESPGYTALPDDFPGYRETMEAIRIVGNLAINVADTQDYWDPDPALPLSYYRNLFLFPAYGGTYTCLGRMFLSTEDRPRLGMKALVLDTGRLLAAPSFGEAVLRWYESMAGGRQERRPVPSPDPRLVSLLGEGFLFHRGSTEPVVAICGDDWEAAMEAVLEYVRLLPASLLALGAVLAFPYFLPAPKVNFAEFSEQIPLALGVLRVPKGEATGERYRKRVQSWLEAPVTLYDVADGVPGSGGRGKESAPLIVQYVRDHALAKLAPVTERVDRVELRTLRQRLADPERQGGKDRRKEMWRLSTAMESAALLLQKPRGRRLDLSPELSRRAQEYLQAHAGEEPAEEIAVGDLPPAPAPPPVESPAAGQLPPWLQRGGPAPVPAARGAKVESVPVSVKDDPSLLPAADRAGPAGRAPDGGPIADAMALRRVVEADILRYLDERLAAATAPPSAAWSAAFEERLLSQFSQLVEARLQALPPPPAPTGLDGRQVDAAVKERLTPALADQAARDAATIQEVKSGLERRMADWSGQQQQALTALTDRLLARAAELEARLGQDSTSRVAQSEERVRADLRALVAQEFDRSVRTLLETKLKEVRDRSAEAVRTASEAAKGQLQAQLGDAMADVKKRAAASETDLRGAMMAQLDLHFRESQDREQSGRGELERRLTALVDQRLAAADQRHGKEAQETERRLSLLVDGRAREVQERVQATLREAEARATARAEEQLAQLEGRIDRKADSKMEELREAEMHAVADLQVRLQSYADQKRTESLDREREKYLELLARLKGETEAAIARIPDVAFVEKATREQFQRSAEAFRNEMQHLMDLRAMAAEERFAREHSDVVGRLEALVQEVADRNREATRLDDALRAELDEIDRRIVVLTDRLVPVVRKSWTRISELERGAAGPAETELKYAELRREFSQDIRRLETELTERTREIRDRVEGSIANQGRVWLTLVRQLSQMTEDRRSGPAPGAVRVREPASRSADVDRDLEQLASLSRAARGTSLDDPDEDPPEDAASRRRAARRSSSAP